MMCVNLSKCVDIIFFSFTSTKKYIYIKVSFVDPAIIINKNNILFKKKRKKNYLEKEKVQVGFKPTSAHMFCIHSPTTLPTRPRGPCILVVAK